MTKLTLTASVETIKTGKRVCPVASDVKILLGEEIVAQSKSPLGGNYNLSQAMKAFKDDFRASKGTLNRFKYTSRGNTLREMVKLCV